MLLGGGWGERLFAKSIIMLKLDGFHYAPESEVLHSIHPAKTLNYARKQGAINLR